MITTDLARRLRAAGVQWTPAPGDRFMIPDRDFDDEVFLVSDMVVEVQDLPTGRLLRFNGTTEWALDSIEDDEVIWLPREDQLRALLGQNFVRLDATPGGFIVTVEVNGQRGRHIDVDAERAYARAVLATTRPRRAR
ncbi:MAG: pilus assembly protein CpaE [Nocardioidaceae bacterium]